MRRTRLFLLVGAALLLLALAGAWQWRVREGNGSAALARGLAALDKGDARTARIELMNAIKADPRSAAARIGHARALVKLGDGAGAQADIARGRKLGAAAGATRALMADALLLQGDSDGALREAQATDVTAKTAPAAARVVARAWLARGDLIATQAAFDHALALAPRDAATLVDMGRFRLAVGDQGGAIMAADGALTLAPADPEALTLRGVLIRDQYGLVAALPWFEKALQANRDSIPALTEYAATLADTGRASAMLSVTRRILALEPGNARAWFMQAVMAARAGKADLARALLVRTNGRLDREPATLLLRGVLHLSDGNAVLAAEVLGPLVAAQPDNRVARTLLGRARYLSADYSGTVAVLAPLVAREDADSYALTLAGRAQEALGDPLAAQDLLARAAAPGRAAADFFAAPQDDARAYGPAPASAATAFDNIPYIRALLRTGRMHEAVERAQLLSRANPGAPAAQIVLGDALGVAGRPADAVRAYEVAANIRFDRAVALRLAGAWSRAGDPARAVQVIRLFLSQNPMDVEAQRLSAAASMQARDWRGALRMLQAIQAQTGGNDALLMADLARTSLESGDVARAQAYAAQAYRLMPASPVTADIYGWTLLRSGAKGQGPVDLLEKAAMLAPGQPSVQWHLGQAYAAAGRKAAAKRALAFAAASNFPDRQQAAKALAAL